MKRISLLFSFIALLMLNTDCYAGCKCDDWVDKGGYCVNYVDLMIPSFPIPNSTTEIVTLKNKEIPEVTVGDVAMFNYSNYWHVAYVEEVHLNHKGAVTAIDVSEMNFGDQLSFDEFKDRWGSASESEWKRAVCCGITENYGQLGSRHRIPLNTVKQIWSPDAAESSNRKLGTVVTDKIREAINRFFLLAGRFL